MPRFIDRRSQSRHKSAVNRQRFLHRYKNQIKKAVSEAITDRSITNIENGEKITIPSKDIREPTFHYGLGGKREIVLPGNQQYVVGDKFKRPTQEIGDGGGSQASSSGDGEDEFVFRISREEFLDLFFDDLELPNLIKTKIANIAAKKMVRTGYTSQGVPANINIIRSLRGAIGRRLAFGSSIKAQLKNLNEELRILEAGSDTHSRVIAIKQEIEKLQARLAHIPFIDPFDLRYNNRVRLPQPTSQAVMFCLMDVSGSMDEAKKDVAKRFFILLYLFLSRNYETIELVFIRHHTSAKEVSEQEFFFSRETGGTVVSTALELMRDIMVHRYPTSDWNIYGAQASDGDNWNNDSPLCRDILMHDIMPHVQYFAYIEIMPRQHQSLWQVYETVADTSKHFAMQTIVEFKDIYPVFRELFKRQHPAIPLTSGWEK